MKELPSDRNRQLGTKGRVHHMNWWVIHLSETSWWGLQHNRKTSRLPHINSQTTGTDSFTSGCSVDDRMKQQWSRVEWVELSLVVHCCPLVVHWPLLENRVDRPLICNEIHMGGCQGDNCIIHQLVLFLKQLKFDHRSNRRDNWINYRIIIT